MAKQTDRQRDIAISVLIVDHQSEWDLVKRRPNLPTVAAHSNVHIG